MSPISEVAEHENRKLLLRLRAVVIEEDFLVASDLRRGTVAVLAMWSVNDPRS